MSQESSTPPRPLHANTASSTPVCEHCGACIDANEWYPVETETAEDGTLLFHSFCSDRCRSAPEQ
ncbi:DUF7576 family protein [Halorientalis pallida]|uniref:MYM-type Zinc finger with FCS sequence motif-containing protein n=1 Tax=Halorientalis pallida TaxID=2479928 RepID=A0A498KUX7_9EURY|nr:hypothetical protein EAF64_09110 [Halorientalis pallida]